MQALGKDIGGLILPRVSLARGFTAASTNNVAGNIIDITSFSQGRANSVVAIVGLQANLDALPEQGLFKGERIIASRITCWAVSGKPLS